MGFWGTLGKIGKVGASFIPGVGPAIGVAADIAGGLIGSGAAKRAAGKQLEAANTGIGTLNQFGQQSRDALGAARDAQRGDASGVLDRSRGYADETLGGQLGALDPYAAQGPAVLAALQGNAYDEWQGGDFKAPTLSDDPGYQFRLAEGQKALERSSAARGTTGGGAFSKALARYGQDFASNEYGKAYDRSANEYDRRYDQFTDRTNQRWKRLSELTDLGYGAASKQAGYRGDWANRMGDAERDYGNRLFDAEGNFARDTTDVNKWQGGNVTDIQLGAGNVNAAGTVGASNAWGDAIQGVASTLGSRYGNRRPPTNYGAQRIGGTFQDQLRRRAAAYGS